MKTKRTIKKLVGSAIVLLLVLISLPSLAVGNMGLTIRVETNQAQYYPGEQVIVTIQLLKNGNGYPGGICPEIWDPYENMLYGGLCYDSDSHGYHNITDFFLDTDAPLGTYTVFVHAYADDWEGTVNITFEVVSGTVTAEAHGPYQGKSGQSIQFTGDVTGGKTPYTWYWQFGDGGISYVRNATHSYLSDGTFNALFTVSDHGGRSDNDSAVVIIQDVTYNLTVKTDESFYFTNQNVTISGVLKQGGVGVSGDIFINITDPNQVLVVTETVPTDVHGTYEYVFHLEINAVLGEYTVLVKEQQYHAANATTFDVHSSTLMANAHGPYHANVGANIQFSGDATGGLAPYSWFWDFGDHTNSTVQNPTHSYQVPGQYIITLTVHDNYQHIGIGNTNATITKEAPENHTVLIEEGTATWCSNCPTVSTILDDLYTSGNYHFYYVAMIEDKNITAKDRLEQEYNIYGYPTVYIDGGYKVLLGANTPVSAFEDAIHAASTRVVPALKINLSTQWNQNTNNVETSVIVHNLGNVTYQGRLRVYLTEINSRWSDYSGKTYHYGFLDYLVNEEVSIPAGGQITRSNITDATGLYPTNLMVIAGVFNATKQQGYSNPPSGNPFDAYYTDATVGKRVVEGNLPPEVGITNPKNGRLHILGKPIIATKNMKTILLGRTNITASATDDSNVTKVEFYIDDKLVATFTTQPYEWMWKKHSWLRTKHTIKVIAYDDEGKTSIATMDVTAFIVL